MSKIITPNGESQYNDPEEMAHLFADHINSAVGLASTTLSTQQVTIIGLDYFTRMAHFCAPNPEDATKLIEEVSNASKKLVKEEKS